ncbi:MAG: hypothetical protein A2Y74_00795 [Actinobacteria bacterium RBG_13_63_9]|jgi:hypothetical protein|nr:MAG: hypothetical protein A2Y74_00795 [Actinobacteria bacterium RBG_13_63_9]
MTLIPPRHTRCPQCQAIGPWREQHTAPFCSERCKWLDLEGWISGRYTIPGEEIRGPERETTPDEEANREPPAKKA